MTLQIFLQSQFLYKKIALTSIYDISMSLEHFEIKKKNAYLITIENRQLSTVPLNFDYSRVWQ